MTEPNEGTPPAEGEAQPAPAAGTPPQPDEVTTLRSRNAGLDAKVTELSKAAKELAAARDALAAQLAEAQKGVLDKDEALRAQLAAKDAELAQARAEAKVARIAQAYPETFGVFGDAVANMTPEQLAAAEARFKGVADAGEPPAPRPVGNSPQRPVGPRPAATAKERLAQLEDQLADAFSTGFADS